jgi:hypothetical protein
MVSSSKILTVSYGTFSCTAEGFDDPLEAVKETTQFFRGVVGEDRFFGAEPPQFDPELASEYLRDRLADSGGTLSLGSPSRIRTAAASAGAMAAAFDTAPGRSAPVADLLPDDDTIDATAVLTEQPEPEAEETTLEVDLGDTAPEGTEATPAPLASAPNDIAAKLDRIRAVVAQAEVDDAPMPAVAPDPSLQATAVMDDAVAPDAVAPDVVMDDVVVPDVVMDDVVVPDVVVPDVVMDDAPASEDALESLLDELVVESGDADEIDLTALAADVATPDPDPTHDTVLADLLAQEANYQEPQLQDFDQDDRDDDSTSRGSIAAATAAIAGLTAGAAMSATRTTDGDHDHDDLDVADARDLQDPVSVETALDAAWAATTAQADDDTPPVAPRARVVKVKRAAFEQAIDDGALEEIVDTTPPPVPAKDSSLSPEEEMELARELAAVKAELASDFGAWDDDDDDDAAPATAPPSQEPLAEARFDEQDDEPDVYDDFDDDDDDDDNDDALYAAVAAATGTEPQKGAQDSAPLRLDNPIAAPATDPAGAFDDIDDDLRDSARKAVKLASPARALLTQQEVEDGDTSRLLDQTNSEMDEPEGNRRRSAIAHLRAAVAATKADKLLGGRKADAEEEQERYREDLASVVRPRRPQTAGARTERPVTEPAPDSSPLKLVAEQRIATEQTAAAAPAPAGDIADPAQVRPRRVRRSAPVSPPEPQTAGAATSGFAAYAQGAGATDLPELLEAAAAYMSYVEGLDQFSRPQLMSTLRQAEASDSSREDRLRSFGQLLREGKIRKTSGGRFTAADHISFKPDRAANG